MNIWLYLLLVVSAQLSSALSPSAAESAAELHDDDVDEGVKPLSKLDLSGESRDLRYHHDLNDKWKGLKHYFEDVDEKMKESFTNGFRNLNKKNLKVDIMKCRSSNCETCLNMSRSKNKFCVEMKYLADGINLRLFEKINKQEQEIIPEFRVEYGKGTTCNELGERIGLVCIQSEHGEVEYKGEKLANQCLGVFIKELNVGAKLCIGYTNGKSPTKFRPKTFVGELKNDFILEADSDGTEAKLMDADPE